MPQVESEHDGSDTDEGDDTSSPRADSSSADEDDDNEKFYDATEIARSNSLQASRSGSLSLPAFETDSAIDAAR